jgi:tetratricopeptide (TPR) repeat protein
VADLNDKTSDKKPAASSDAKAADPAGPRFDPKAVKVGGESIVDRLYPHRKKIGLFILSAAVIWAVVAIVIHYKDAGSEQATDKLAAVLDLGDKPVKAPEPAGSAGSAAPSALDSYPDVKTRANALLDALAKQGTHQAGPVYRASLLVQAGKLDDAIAEYKRGQGELGIDGVLAREGLGLAQEQKAVDPKNDAQTRQTGLQEALATFESMQPDDKGPRRDFALYHQGRIQALLGKTADAKASFEKAKDLAKTDPELAELVEQHLESLGT